VPAAFRKLDAVAVLTARLLPAPRALAQRDALMRRLRRCQAVPLLGQAGDVEFPYGQTGLTPKEAEELSGRPTLAEVRKAVELRLGIWQYMERARERHARRRQGQAVDGAPDPGEHHVPVASVQPGSSACSPAHAVPPVDARDRKALTEAGH
jgi:hypothetical protein